MPPLLATSYMDLFPKFIKGVRSYRRSSYSRTLENKPVFWEEGHSRLYGHITSDKNDVILLIPSLINQSTIMDFDEGQSLFRFLGQEEFNTYLLEWGNPQKDLSFEDYLKEKLFKAATFLYQKHKKPINIVGYCMGSLFTLALGQLLSSYVNKLVVLAPPWDFQAGDFSKVSQFQDFLSPLLSNFKNTSILPEDFIHCLFYARHPFQSLYKFADFSETLNDIAREKRFVLIEDWLAQGYDISYKIIEECFYSWFLENGLVSRAYKVMGQCLDPKSLTQKTMVVVPLRDKVVPPESSEALIKQLINPYILRLNTGHLGLMASPTIANHLWPEISSFLKGKEL
jgi:polyhydroxyalkanoate synthase subunit PhaC